MILFIGNLQSRHAFHLIPVEHCGEPVQFLALGRVVVCRQPGVQRSSSNRLQWEL